MERGVSVRGVNSSECGVELRRPGRGRRCVADTLVIRSKVRSGAGGLRAARRAHLGPTVTLTREGSADASLSALSLSGVTLSPAFASWTMTYTASVANRVTETAVTATASDVNASVEVTPEDADDETPGD